MEAVNESGAKETEHYTVATELNDGIERITYTPKVKRHDIPILMQHGMWHGAWCWAEWQAILAEQGWESHAISLPGHGASPATKSVRFSTMGDYLSVLKQEIERLPRRPVLMGHSMGGALVQWYLKKVVDDLPAVVLVAAWTAHSTWGDGTLLHLKRDPVGFTLVGLTLSTQPLVRNAERAASMLITEGAIHSPEELHGKLCEESALVLNQHNPPLWRPLRDLKTPILWLGAELDAVVSLKGAQRSAEFYGAEFQLIEGVGHNLMMEKNFRETALKVDRWLQKTV